MSYNKKNTNNAVSEDINIIHIDVLDGIRAIAVFIVVWFHIWQQSWLMPIVNTPALSFLNINSINLDWLPRTGYIMVTMMIFLSGFCLFLPYARHEHKLGELPKTSTFFRKRVARILPSYLFCIIVVLIYNLATHQYTAPTYAMHGDSTFMFKDLFTHLTFTFNLFKDVSTNTLLNGVLWTVALEVQFYIIFPAIQSFFRKKPILTYIIMNAISFAFIIYARKNGDNSFLLHQLPSYLGVYANGFVGAWIFVGIAKKIKRDNLIGMISTITSLFCIYVYYLMMQDLCSAQSINGWQMHNRYFLSVLFMIFILSTCFSLSWYRKIFSNAFMRFMSTISFNFYIWHQFLTIAFKKNRIPYFEGDTPPNELNPQDKVWMWTFMLLCFAASFAAAIIATYGIEKPCSKFIMNLKRKTHSGKSAGK